MESTSVSIEQLSINTIRTLSMDAVQAANSGHPGTPMALAPVAYALWSRWLRYDPRNPEWPDRDRFVLSCGHASMLLYSILHLSGVTGKNGEPAVSLEDIRNFRQLGSPCAGHPEYGEVTGAETTTGPLGQGVANSVGMAIASRWMAARYNRPGKKLFGYRVFAICSDGDLMEGISYEAASVAGHLQLGNLCWIYDDNRITIEGSTDLAFSEDVAARFEAIGWNTATVKDANDIDSLNAEFERFDGSASKPLLIIVKSVIGYGAPNKQDTASAHGSPLGDSEIRLAKDFYGWPVDETFLVPSDVRQHFDETLGKRGESLTDEWTRIYESYQQEFPAMGNEIAMLVSRKLPTSADGMLNGFFAGEKAEATRNSSGRVLNHIASQLPWLIGGSADLAGSNNSVIEAADAGDFSAENHSGRNFHFGVRELSMASICNGMSLSGIRPYCATFFVFTDYLRPALRLSALMHQPVIYVLTHDSIGLGEDGPTHQPVEHLAACRAIPNLLVLRPADAAETAVAWSVAVGQTRRPSAIVLTRQKVPQLPPRPESYPGRPEQGACVVYQPHSDCDVILMGSGSEVSVCVEAAKRLEKSGHHPRVVSMLSMELFREQGRDYHELILPSKVTRRVAVEAGIEMGWERWIGPSGFFVGMTGFGASAPAEVLYEHFGITADRVAETVLGS